MPYADRCVGFRLFVRLLHPGGACNSAHNCLGSIDLRQPSCAVHHAPASAPLCAHGRRSRGMAGAGFRCGALHGASAAPPARGLERRSQWICASLRRFAGSAKRRVCRSVCRRRAAARRHPLSRLSPAKSGSPSRSRSHLHARRSRPLRSSQACRLQPRCGLHGGDAGQRLAAAPVSKLHPPHPANPDQSGRALRLYACPRVPSRRHAHGAKLLSPRSRRAASLGQTFPQASHPRRIRPRSP